MNDINTSDSTNMTAEKVSLTKITFLQILIASMIAGSAEVLANHPLWVVKTRIQCGYKPVWAFQGIYQGIFSNMFSMVPLIALRLSLGTLFQKKFFDSKQKPSSSQRIISALAGGCIPSLVGSPLELLRTKQLKSKLSLLSTAKVAINNHGPSYLFSGMLGTATRDALYTCGFFALAPIVKEKIKPYVEKDWMASILAGPIAGTFAAFSSQPFDAIKMRQQILREQRKVRLDQAIWEIIKESGFKGFFRGATPRILRVISGVTVISTVNEKVTKYYQNKNSTDNKPSRIKL
jgi:solute carrier family 25 citrate transporter 1